MLIADDHVDAAETLAMLVGLEGYAVEVARNGQDALTLARRLRPDVVILDIGMPGLDGHAVAHRIRQTQDGASMLIVALSGRGDAEDKERARVAGFDEHFTKPVDPALLMGCIGTWGRRRRIHPTVRSAHMNSPCVEAHKGGRFLKRDDGCVAAT